MWGGLVILSVTSCCPNQNNLCPDGSLYKRGEPVTCVPSVCTKPCLMCPTKAFVNAVKKNVDEMEESVSTAERELGSHKIQKVLKSIPGLRQVSLKLNVFYDKACQYM